MANLRYFTECNGKTVQLARIFHSGQRTNAVDFTGTCPACGQKHVASRKIEYKRSPSKHECDARCIGASGKSMQCECSCGGKNHGKAA